MNFGDLLENLWIATGYPDTGSDRQDMRLQQYKDNLNTILDEICATCAPSLFRLIRQDTIAILPNVDTYTLNDWCARPLSVYTADMQAHKVRYLRPRTADFSGIRNTNYRYPQFGPYTLTDGMRTMAPILAGVNGVSGASVAEGSTAVTFPGAVGTPWNIAAVIGRMMRFNGEDGDYKVVATDGSGLTLDRKAVTRIKGVGVGNVGAGYTNVDFEISPPGRLQLQILPLPTMGQTINYRFMAHPRRMLNLTDNPEIDTQYHHLIWKGALRLIACQEQNADQVSTWQQEYLTALSQLQKSDTDDFDSDDSPRFETLRDRSTLRYDLPGTNRRGMCGYN